ncbi:adenylate/guanylate cyclase domain-containing protein [Sneathiella sp.]|jgi:adenylate cyclase|uniref:adenylate/guanylate cyclase domain-containing protein n=1 Tax=Sneathiella sp. TaxID=1964365 RepID=UPI0039E30A4C
MTAENDPSIDIVDKHRWVRASSLRLYSGLVLMVFLCMHLINHSLGLISLDAMEAGRTVFVAVWRNPLGTVILLLAMMVHVVLVFAKLLAHRSYKRIPAKEVLQITMGLAIPPLLAGHLIGTRVSHELIGIHDSYAYVLFNLWIAAPEQAAMQTAGTLVAWLHGCLGLHFWLRLKPWYEDAFPYLYTIAIILPLLALTGFVNGANEVETLLRDPIWKQNFFDALGITDAKYQWYLQVREVTYIVIVVLLMTLLLSRIFWFIYFRRETLISITYPDGRIISGAPGSTILEISQLGNIPHAAVCGGRGRCSTCRVRIISGEDTLPPPSDKELAVLKRVGASEGTRLACQIQAVSNLSVAPLLPAKATARHSFSRPRYLQGEEKEIAILFADLRSFTKFSEHKLPYDVVFVINQYFRHMGEAIERSGGHLDKFIGDGVMALFGLEDKPDIAARKALSAAKEMAIELDLMNKSLKSDLSEPLQIGIGVHIGSVIVGEMGYGKATSITAIGDAVNTASRLENMNKEYGSQLIFSEKTALAAGFEGNSSREKVMIRGRNEPLGIHIIKDAMTLQIDKG